MKRVARPCAAVSSVCALVLLPPLAGCRTVGEDGGPDMSYIRVAPATPDDRPAVDTATPIPLLFPTGESRRWEMAVSVGDRRMTEQIRVGAPRRVGRISGAVTLEMRKDGGKAVYREESYLISRDSIKLVAAGGDDKMVMDPPMPLLDLTTPEGVERRWAGTIYFKGAEAPARAVTRLRSKEKVTTPAGTFDAYRVDTALTTIIEGRSITFPASRWFAQGVGIVKQRFQVGRAVVLKELTGYKEQ